VVGYFVGLCLWERRIASCKGGNVVALEGLDGSFGTVGAVVVGRNKLDVNAAI